MSAFIVSDAHINAIVSWIARPENNHGRVMLTADCQAAGLMLISENARSVGCRYANIAEMVQDCADSIRAYEYRAEKTTRSAVKILKACQCLAYQSCEHDGWDESQAKLFLDEVQGRAISKLPGYEEAAWGIC